MKLIAFDMRSMIIMDSEQATLYRDGICATKQSVSKYMVSRLDCTGFKVVDMEVESLQAAWDIVQKEALKSSRVSM